MTIWPDDSGIPGGAEPIAMWDSRADHYCNGIEFLHPYDWQSWLPEFFDAVSTVSYTHLTLPTTSAV